MRLYRSDAHAPALVRFDPLAFVVLAVLTALALGELLFAGAIAGALAFLLALLVVAACVVGLALLPLGVVTFVVRALED